MSLFSSWLDRSLGRRIAVMVGLLLSLTAGALVVVFYFQVAAVTERNTAERLRLLTNQLSELLARAPATAVADLSRIAADPDVARFLANPPGSVPAPPALDGAVRGETRRALAVVDSRGEVRLEKGSQLQPAWFGPGAGVSEERRSGAVPAVGGFRSLGDSTLYYDVRVPVRSGNSELGALVARYRVTGSSTGRTALANLLGTSTTLLIGARNEGTWTDLAGPVAAPPEQALTPQQLNRFASDSGAFLGYAQNIPGTSWTLVVRAPQATAMAPARAFLGRAATFAGLAILIGALGAALLGRRLNRPLRAITEATEGIAAGNYSGRVDEASPGEVGRLARAFNVMADEVKTSTQRLQESEASHRAFVAHASEGIWRLELPEGADIGRTADDQIASWYDAGARAECNAVLAEMVGIPSGYDLVQVEFSRLYPRDDGASLHVLQAFIARGHRCTGVETRDQRNGDASRIFTHDLIGIVEEGHLRRIWGTRRDVTLERGLDERIAQSQRLESVGRLAGGIAHDFNNLLTVILADTEAIQSRVGGQDAELIEIETAARRAADLTRQLLAFSRGQVLRPLPLDLNQVIQSFQTMLRRVIGEDIDLRLRLAPKLPAIEADPGQIERVVMNLVVNARDAMPKGGVLELRTEALVLDEAQVRDRPGVQSGPHVMLAVSDTGAGMTEEVRKKAFEPFFTTKPKGRGTGLGLASVYGVVRQSGGDISLYSEPGHGTTVKIYLPAAGEAPVTRAPQAAAPVTRSTTGGTLLLVEDDPAVRKMVHRSLEGFGFQVLEAPDGEAALRAVAEAQGKVDVVLTDMVMPGLSGVELARRIRASWPKIGIVMMSGYSGDTYVDADHLPSEVEFLEKPFAVAELHRVILAAAGSAARVDESDQKPVS